MAFDFIAQTLNARKQQHLFRKVSVVESVRGAMIEVQGQHYLNFSSNDYLGQRQNPLVLQAYLQGVVDYGAGSGASPLVTGHTRAHQQLQDYLADKLGVEAVLLFNSGYAANQAICQALLSQGVSVLADKLMHASFIDGARAHCKHFKRYKHNDLIHLHQLLQACSGDCLIATEGVFSMDGDQAPLAKLAECANTHNAWLMVDDAHGFGVLGEQGMGSVSAQSLFASDVAMLMGTFGKAVGTGGAFIAASQNLIDYLCNFGKHYIYSTAMAPAQAMATQASIESLADGAKQQQLDDNIRFFLSLCEDAGVQLMPSTSAIQPVLIHDAAKCLAISDKLRGLGLWVTAMRYPTVAKGQERLRITLTVDHLRADIEALVDGLVLCGLGNALVTDKG